jgi:hypothetical protein
VGGRDDRRIMTDQDRGAVWPRDSGKERDAHRCYTEGKRQTFEQLFCVEPHGCLHPCGVEIKLGGEKRCDGHHANGDCCVSQGVS